MVELDEGFCLPTHFHQCIPFTKEALQHNGDISVLLQVSAIAHELMPEQVLCITKEKRITGKTGYMETIKPHSIKTAHIYGSMGVCYKTTEP